MRLQVMPSSINVEDARDQYTPGWLGRTQAWPPHYSEPSSFRAVLSQQPWLQNIGVPPGGPPVNQNLPDNPTFTPNFSPLSVGNVPGAAAPQYSSPNLSAILARLYGQ